MPKTQVLENFEKETRSLLGDVRLENGSTLLHDAVADGNVEKLQALLDKGAYPNVLANNNYTALAYAELMVECDVIDKSTFEKISSVINTALRKYEAQQAKERQSEAAFRKDSLAKCRPPV